MRSVRNVPFLFALALERDRRPKIAQYGLGALKQANSQRRSQRDSFADPHLHLSFKKAKELPPI